MPSPSLASKRMLLRTSPARNTWPEKHSRKLGQQRASSTTFRRPSSGLINSRRMKTPPGRTFLSTGHWLMSLPCSASPCRTPSRLFPQRDPKWVGLAFTYFSGLTWRLEPENLRLLELMLDITVTYQTCLLLKVKLFAGHFAGAPCLQQASKSYYWLPSPMEQLRLPKRMLSEWSHTFLAFFDLISNITTVTPGPRVKAESLSQYGYNNVLPTICGREYPQTINPQW